MPGSEPLFRTQRLQARRLTREDSSLIYRLYRDEESVRYLGTPPLADEGAAVEMLETMLVRNEEYGNRKGAWALEQPGNGQAVGTILCKHPRASDSKGALSDKLEVGWHLAPEQRGQGFATEAARGILGYAFERLNAKEVYILTEVPHRKSQAVAERLGLRARGQTREFYDIEMTYFVARPGDLV